MSPVFLVVGHCDVRVGAGHCHGPGRQVTDIPSGEAPAPWHLWQPGTCSFVRKEREGPQCTLGGEGALAPGKGA